MKYFQLLKKAEKNFKRRLQIGKMEFFYTDYLETVLKRATTDNTDTLMQYIIVKEQLNKTKLQTFRQLHENLSVEKTPDWLNLKKLRGIAIVQHSVSSSRCFYFYIRTSKLNEPKNIP